MDQAVRSDSGVAPARHDDPAPVPPSTARRGFLRALAVLPLIGGGMKLIGNPIGVAAPASRDLLLSYKAWLHYEHRMVSYELAGYDLGTAHWIENYIAHDGEGAHWHFQWVGVPGAQGPAGWQSAPQPSTRAALVLSAVGCPLPAMEA